MGRMSDLAAAGDQYKRTYAMGGAGYRKPVTNPPNTSQQAAKSAHKKLQGNEQAVYDVLVQHEGGLTADEIALRLDWHVTRVRPRLTGLRDKIRIKQTDKTRKSEQGKASAVWVALVGRG